MPKRITRFDEFLQIFSGSRKISKVSKMATNQGCHNNYDDANVL